VFAINGTVAGWLLVLEFIFTLAMALRCYPLQPGGLLAIVRSPDHRDQHRHKHPERGDAERSGRIPVPADLRVGAADPAVLRAHGG
jgi:hypothetical protein